MRNVFQLAASILIGLLSYVAVFTSIVHRPMTIDSLGVYLDRKSELLKSVPGRRILVLAGSNGRFSHSCEELERVTGIPGINLSINAEISLAYQFRRYLPLMHPGDVLYLPLEYRSRSFPKSDWVGVESNFLIYKHVQEIFQLYSPAGALHSLFNFDIRYLISSIGGRLRPGA